MEYGDGDCVWGLLASLSLTTRANLGANTELMKDTFKFVDSVDA